MKKRAVIRWICSIFIAIGIFMIFYCWALWAKLLGALIVAVTVIAGIDFFPDDV